MQHRCKTMALDVYERDHKFEYSTEYRNCCEVQGWWRRVSVASGIVGVTDSGEFN